ncbi:hypothetical protein DCC81_24410 [Chitinophaga parva]|uniref:Uncharacterized protein n=1 Tax=Chitinophaga parva TaxID=2169414 RepID=A0A2T7BBG5_9BACT|nr:hypothetical protein DCC81_24410 [Chitinophaga parva]
MIVLELSARGLVRGWRLVFDRPRAQRTWAGYGTGTWCLIVLELSAPGLVTGTGTGTGTWCLTVLELSAPGLVMGLPRFFDQYPVLRAKQKARFSADIRC